MVLRASLNLCLTPNLNSWIGKDFQARYFHLSRWNLLCGEEHRATEGSTVCGILEGADSWVRQTYVWIYHFLIMQPCLSHSAFLSLFHLENDSYDIFFTGIVIRAVVKTKVKVLSTGGCWGQFNPNRNPQFGMQWRRKFYSLQTAQLWYSIAVRTWCLCNSSIESQLNYEAAWLWSSIAVRRP